MARLPDANSLGAVPTPVSQRPTSGYQGGIAEAGEAAIGDAVAKAGSGIFKAGDAIQDAQDHVAVAGASSAMLRARLDADQKYESDPDYLSAPDRYAKDLQAARDQAAGQIGSPALRQKFAFAADDIIARGVATQREQSRKKSLDALGGWTLNLLDQNRDAAARTSDEGGQIALLQTSLAAVDGAVAKGAFKAEEAERLKQSYREKFAETIVKAMPPEQGLRYLLGGPQPGQGGAAGSGAPGALPPTLDAAIGDAATKNDVPADALRRVAMVESGGRTDAANPSGAAGAFQLMPATARQYGVTDPNDPGQAADATARLMKDNRAALGKSLGRDPSAAELYLAHQQGAAGAAALLKEPDRPAIDALADVYGDIGKARAAVLQNGGSVDISAGDFAKLQTGRFEKAPGAAVPAGAPALADLPAGPQPKRGSLADFISADRSAALVKTFQDRIHTSEVRANQEHEKQQQAFSSDFEIALSRGEKDYSDIEDAYRAGSITPQSRTRFTLFLDDQRAKRQGDAELMARAAAAGQGGAPLDPKSKEDKKAVDLLYDATATAWQSLPPDQVLDRAIGFSVQKGIVPEKVRGVIRAGLHSGDPGQAVMAADAMKRLRNANPQLLTDIGDENDRRLGTLIGSLTDAGVPAAQAVQRATESLKVNKADMEARAADYDLQRGKTEADRLGSDKSWIEGKLNSIWTADPTVDPVMAREFGDLAGAEYQRTGSLDAARQYALDTVNRVWGRTKVGGALRYMKFAPEKFYGVPELSPDDNAKWMNDQLVADASRGALADPANPITPDRLLVMPDPTRHAPDGRPVYTVSLKGSDGVYRAVTKGDAATPLAWAPDWNASAEKQRRDAATAAKVDAARAARKAGVSGPVFVPDSIGGGIALP